MLEKKIAAVDSLGTTEGIDPVVVTSVAEANDEKGTEDQNLIGGSEDAKNDIEDSDLTLKVIEDETNQEAVSEFDGVPYSSENGNKYKIIVPKFMFKGTEYVTTVVVEQMPDLLEDLLKLNSFIFKKI